MSESLNERAELKQLLIDNSSVSVYYGDKVFDIPLSKAKEIAAKLNITVEELVGREAEDDS